MSILGSSHELDSTDYPADKIPEIALRALMASLRIPESWRKAIAREDLLVIQVGSKIPRSTAKAEDDSGTLLMW